MYSDKKSEMNCKHCNKKLIRRVDESSRDWGNRRYCSNTCSGLARRKATIIKECLTCGKEFKDYETGDKKFCSHKCYSSSLKGKQPWNKGTEVSKEEKERLLELLLTNWDNPEFREKRSGENSHFWGGGKSSEKYTNDWTEELRINIRERDSYMCQVCGKKQGDITHHVHHIDYNKKNCSPKNLITLCVSCHSKTNFDRDEWIKFFKNV